MCNENNYGKAMQSFVEYKRLEKSAKAEKEKLQKELIEYMKSENLRTLEFDGIKATYTEYQETSFDKKTFETKAPKTFEKIFARFHKTVNKSRFVCN